MIPIQVTLQFLRNGTKETKWVRLSMDQTVGDTLAQLISDLDLPTHDHQGRGIRYQLVHQRHLLEDYRLVGETEIAEGNILQLHTLDANSTQGIQLGQTIAGGLLSRLGGKGSEELLPVSAVLANSAGRVVFQIRRARALIGRADPAHGYSSEALDADMTELDERRTVSRPHALIAYSDRQFTIRDLYSQHGCYVNGVKLAPNMASPLQNGDALKFGDVELRFHCDAE